VSRADGSDRTMVSALLGTHVTAEDGAVVGRVRDLVVDLAVGLDRVPVTGGLIERRGASPLSVPWSRLTSRRDGDGMVLVGTEPVVEHRLTPSEVFVRRDILDSPVVLTDPPRRARVSDVVLERDVAGTWAAELDVSTAGALRRLLGTSRPAAVSGSVRLSEVILASAGGHAAQLAAPGTMVFRLGPAEMAEVLTRVSVAHARDILRVADHRVLEQALSLLHPHVRSRVTGTEPSPRRVRRLAGWRLHRPAGGRDRGSRS
jgi:sporulation protein YlmC with PRC-barrel domain